MALTGTVVPPGFVGVALLGLLALANSDADSQLLTVASSVTHDLLPHLGIDPGDRTSALLDRIAVLGLGAAAVLVAAAVPDLTALFGALGPLFSILGVVVVATLFWDGMTDTAAFAGPGVGTLSPIVFVALTGNVRAATMAGLVPAAVTIGAASFVADRSG